MPHPTTTTGVIVGRFQVFELNSVHQKLIDAVKSKHSQVIIFLASNPAPSDYHPLDWAFRWVMFEEVYGESIQVLEMPDLPDDRVWSQELDRRILEQRPAGEVVVYGTEDEFVQRYSGRYDTHILEAQEEDFKEIDITSETTNFRDFRAGVIYATLARYPTVYPTVDIAVVKPDHTQVLLARKANENRYRFPGGFTDPEDESYEEAALRELGEECGEITVANLIYLGSAKIDDWRYRGSQDAVMTHLYICTLEDGEPVASDDIAELRWFEVRKIKADIFVAEHQVLWGLLESYLSEERDSHP